MSTPASQPNQPSNFDFKAIEAACVALREAENALDKAQNKQRAVMVEVMEAYGAKGDFCDEARATAVATILEARTAARAAYTAVVAADELVLAAFRKK